MAIIVTFVLVGAGIAGLFRLGAWAGRRAVGAGDPELAKQLRYQPAALALAVALVLIGRLLIGDGGDFIRAGSLAEPTRYLGFFGISDGTPWTSAWPYVVGYPLLATTIVVYLQVFRGGARPRWAYLPRALAWSLLFSLMNSLTEELVFRVLGLEGLGARMPETAIALLCAAWFGIPHWFGKPGGPIGVLMAGFLGWLIAISMQQTGGLAIGWAIHFAQDVPILTFLLLLSRGSTHSDEH